MCVDGDFKIIYNGLETNYKKGNTFLVPAAMENFSMIGKASVLEIYIS